MTQTAYCPKCRKIKAIRAAVRDTHNVRELKFQAENANYVKAFLDCYHNPHLVMSDKNLREVAAG